MDGDRRCGYFGPVVNVRRALVAVLSSMVALSMSGLTASAGARPSQTTIPADQAGAAIAATLAQASRTGMTFTSRGGGTYQRSADGRVVAQIENGKVIFIKLFNGTNALDLAPLEWVSPRERATIPRQLSAAYGIGKNPWGNAFGETEEPDLINPFLGATGLLMTTVEVDSQGRAVKLLVDGSTEVEVLDWKAPLAVAPAPNRILDADKLGTVQNLEVSADSFYDSIYEFTREVNANPRYRLAPLQVLRQVTKVKGWPAQNTARGISITLTDGLGAIWKADIVAERKVARITSYKLLSAPPIMNADIANARLRLGMLALSAAERIACPRECVLKDTSVPLDYDKLVPRLAVASGLADSTPATPGPDFPGSTGEKSSIGVEGTAADFIARSSTEELGYCVSIALRGPGVPVMPTSYEAKPGSVGPYGRCVP